MLEEIKKILQDSFKSYCTASGVTLDGIARQIRDLIPEGELLRKASLTLLIAEIQNCQPNPKIVVILDSWIKANDLHPEAVESYDSIEELKQAWEGENNG